MGGGESEEGSQGYVAEGKGCGPCSRCPGRRCVLQTLVLVDLVSSTWGSQTGPKKKMYFFSASVAYAFRAESNADK